MIGIPTIDGIEDDMILIPVRPVIIQGSVCSDSGSGGDLVVGIGHGSGNYWRVVRIDDGVAIGSGALSEVVISI